MKLSNLIPIFSLIAVPMAACGASGGGNTPATVPAGSWGGEHVSMRVTDSGTTVQFDCAHGQIPSLLSLDAEGHFEVEGVFVREHGGPVHQVEADASQPAVYSGRLDGNELTLNIRLTEDGTESGPFTAKLGAQARLFRCV